MASVVMNCSIELASALPVLARIAEPPEGLALDLEPTVLESYPDPVLNDFGRPIASA